MLNSKRIVELLEEYKQLKELAEKQSDNLKEALKIIESLQKERNLYKNAWEDLQGFCFRFCEDNPDARDIIFPNTDERGLGEGDTPTDLSPLDL